ncbi:MAG: hypothetical protein IPL07_05455 [Acidimicrobiaceae bacterium]|nr:hypothetical protein [Acidimicrobiaceae bacterium]
MRLVYHARCQQISWLLQETMPMVVIASSISPSGMQLAGRARIGAPVHRQHLEGRGLQALPTQELRRGSRRRQRPDRDWQRLAC